ncbi:3522_t:CDS:1 [Dentiscutata heterogama]|uniref:3522_t:CDS:1 n=1 Tax=Dentiscutata heterogama TaxID=1316150 RepID=A0ACA9LPX5_9GLOM|nr:3522_t:CDS:1 [Dentiscutata heterogama]
MENKNVLNFSDAEKSINEYSELLESYLKKYNVECFDYSKFSDPIYIGHGGFATVHSTAFEGNKYALKKLNNNWCINRKAFNQLKCEPKILNDVEHVEHQNIIKFYRISREQISGDFMLVLQLANDGSLQDYLRKKQGTLFTKFCGLNLFKLQKILPWV